jgi:methylamine dehydrogenase accessory protein MauD
MNAVWLISYIVLWVIVLLLGFLLLGTLRTFGILRWRLDQLEATSPSRVGRRGLKIGAKAPDFTLPDLQGREVSLHDFAGRSVLLVFMQPGCAPCDAMVPTLNRLHVEGEYNVIAIAHRELEAVLKWVEKIGATFPVLLQEQHNISIRYEALVGRPFAFLIDEQMMITSKGVMTDSHQIDFLLSLGRAHSKSKKAESTAPRN